jgi:hypothetical protein
MEMLDISNINFFIRIYILQTVKQLIRMLI